MSKEMEHDRITPRQETDEALFAALGRSKKRKKRRILLTVLIVVLVVAVAVVIAVGILRDKVEQRFNAMTGEVLEFTARTGTVSAVVSGTGVLENVDTETVTLPEGVELEQILVEFGDTVQEGQLLAIADTDSVKTALAEAQDTIDQLDAQLGEAEDEQVSSYIRSGVSGRVKRICAQEDEKVTQVMLRDGALAVLSLDGYMAVDIPTDSLTPGQSVTVTLSDGQTTAGTVETVVAGIATVLVTDNGPAWEESVTVSTEDGRIGAGRLYIHSPLAITGYAGTVDSVYVKENSKVSDGTKLFHLKDTATRANYDTLLRQRNEAEQTLLELLQIQRSGGVTAPMGGSVFSVAELEEDKTVTEVATISPDTRMSVTVMVDEGDILALELGQTAQITVGSVSNDALTGVVTEIDKTAASGYYTATVELDKLAGMLPGMTAEVDIRIQGVENALLIPVEALQYTSAGAYVYTAYDPQLQQYGGRTDVVTGLQGSEYVEIKSGLQPGDKVYYTESMTFMDLFMNMAGMGGGQQPQQGQFPESQIPEGYEGQLPEGYEGQLPEGYEGQLPEGFGG